jgi:hypothetical protein
MVYPSFVINNNDNHREREREREKEREIEYLVNDRSPYHY